MAAKVRRESSTSLEGSNRRRRAARGSSLVLNHDLTTTRSHPCQAGRVGYHGERIHTISARQWYQVSSRLDIRSPTWRSPERGVRGDSGGARQAVESYARGGDLCLMVEPRSAGSTLIRVLKDPRRIVFDERAGRPELTLLPVSRRSISPVIPYPVGAAQDLSDTVVVNPHRARRGKRFGLGLLPYELRVKIICMAVDYRELSGPLLLVSREFHEVLAPYFWGVSRPILFSLLADGGLIHRRISIVGLIWDLQRRWNACGSSSMRSCLGTDRSTNGCPSR